MNPLLWLPIGLVLWFLLALWLVLIWAIVLAPSRRMDRAAERRQIEREYRETKPGAW